MKDKIIDIIVDIGDDETIKENLGIDLIENEVLDSLGFIILMQRLEEEFDVEIQPTQIPLDTWRNINSIVEFIENIKGK